MYVPNSAGAASVTVLKAHCDVVRTIPLSSTHTNEPLAASYDPLDSEIYIVPYFGCNVVVISGLEVEHTIHVRNCGEGFNDIIWDPAANLMIATDYSTNAVYAFSGNVVVGHLIPVGQLPSGLDYDPCYNEILVVDAGTSNVTVLSASDPFSGSHLSIPVGLDPQYIAYDPSNHTDYVTNFYYNVSVINGAGAELGAVPTGGNPLGIAWSPAAHQMYVGDYGSTNVWIVKGLNVTHTFNGVWGVPVAMAYDEFDKGMYVTTAFSLFPNEQGTVWELT